MFAHDSTTSILLTGRPSDLGYGDLGFTGHPTTSTPNIDKLAYGGLILNSWYSGCPVCSGSRGPPEPAIRPSPLALQPLCLLTVRPCALARAGSGSHDRPAV